MVDLDDLRQRISERREWLLVPDYGPSFPLLDSEIGVTSGDDRDLISFIDDGGLRNLEVTSFVHDGDQLVLDTADAGGIRLIPRTPAAELSHEVEALRLKKANETADLLTTAIPGSRVGRVAINEPGGRFCQIEFVRPDGVPAAAVCDLTGKLAAEYVFLHALNWLEALGMRKKPVLEIDLILERSAAAGAQRLSAMLTNAWRSKINVWAIDRRSELPRLELRNRLTLSSLWRDKAAKLKVTDPLGASKLVDRIRHLAPEEIDLSHSRNGVSLRYNGLAFARVRRIAGRDHAWFGVGRQDKTLDETSWPTLRRLVSDLAAFRNPDAAEIRHSFFRLAPEAWLESLLRRDIRSLDANLVLSPIHSQFRTAADKIDLLALRRDGRLVIIELKTHPDRQMVFQAAEYWRKIELQRRRGILAAANLFDGREIADRPAIIYLVSPAWSVHRDIATYARMLSSQIELWLFDLHQDWRREIKVVDRQRYAASEGSRSI